MEMNNVCYATLNFKEPWTLKNYLKVGGYKAWKKIISKKTNKNVYSIYAFQIFKKYY